MTKNQSKYRTKIIQEMHLKRPEQRMLDEYVTDGDYQTLYAEVRFIRKLRDLAKAFDGVAEWFNDSLKEYCLKFSEMMRQMADEVRSAWHTADDEPDAEK